MTEIIWNSFGILAVLATAVGISAVGIAVFVLIVEALSDD